MKKLWWILWTLALLTGCGGGEQAVFETIGEQAYEAVSAPEPEVISVWVPDGASLQTAADAGLEIYVWEDYELRVATRPAGDIDGTLMELTGRSPNALTVMSYAVEDLQLYKSVWSAVGEEGVTIGRCMVADDGDYHYCITLLSPEEVNSAELYAEICGSFSLEPRDAGK